MVDQAFQISDRAEIVGYHVAAGVNGKIVVNKLPNRRRQFRKVLGRELPKPEAPGGEWVHVPADRLDGEDPDAGYR